MAGNQRNVNLNGSHGAHRPHVPTGPVSPGSRPLDTQLPPGQLLSGAPRAGLPVNVVRGRSVEISDVSGDLRTINDMREDLTEYTIFRFEKMSAQNQYDDEGRPQLPTWDRAIRARVPGISPREIIREIQHLNRNTRNLSDKLKSLSPVLQRQVDKAQEDLALENPDPINYHWVLVQLDHQLREIGPYLIIARRRHSTHRTRYGPNRRRSDGRSSNRHERKSYERISLRAFFKRTPRPNADIAMLWEAKNLRGNQVVRSHSQHQNQRSPQNPQQSHANQQPQLQPSSGSDPRAQRPGPILPPGIGTSIRSDGVRGPLPATPYPNKSGMNNGVNPLSNAAIGNTPIGRGRENERTRNYGNQIDVESDSDYSNYLSMDGSIDSQMTPDTSQPGSPRNGIGRGGGDGGRVPIGNKSMRYDGGISDRPISRGQQYPNVKSGPRIQPATAPGPHHSASSQHLAPPSQVDIGRVREEAYLAGMRHGRDGKRVFRERAYREGKRPRSKPRTFPGARPPSPPYRRHMSNSDPEGLRHRIELDEGISRFNRLSLDEEEDHDRLPRRADARQRREFEYLMHQGSVLEDDPFDCERLPHSRHGSRRFQETYISDDSESDLSLPERGNGWSGY